MVVSNILDFHRFLEQRSNLISIFQMGWNYQLDSTFAMNKPFFLQGEKYPCTWMLMHLILLLSIWQTINLFGVAHVLCKSYCCVYVCMHFIHSPKYPLLDTPYPRIACKHIARTKSTTLLAEEHLLEGSHVSKVCEVTREFPQRCQIRMLLDWQCFWGPGTGKPRNIWTSELDFWGSRS